MRSVSVGIAMSGGVDSTVSAALLKEQGYSVHGFFMLLPLPDLEGQLRRVREVAATLAVPLHLVDLRQSFRQEVVAYFVHAYGAGTTPNPCIRCNRTIKFGRLMKAMEEHGMELMATGHYAKITAASHQFSFALCRGTDSAKDQSYFLCRLDLEQRRRLILPLGSWSKPQVYDKAEALGFCFSRVESQDVCFLGGSLAHFLAEQGLEHQEGEVVDRRGKVLGSHRGCWQYTIGQRRGLGLPDATPWYVIGLDGVNNRVIVGKASELLQSRVRLHSVRWHHRQTGPEWRGRIQLRSRHRAALARAVHLERDCWQVTFSEQQRAITPGQFAVLYENDMVVASGVIDDGITREGP